MLHCCQSDATKDVVPFDTRPRYEYAYLFRLRRQFLDDLSCGLRIDVSRTLLIKHKSQRIRASSNRGLRILQIRDSANLDPGHENHSQRTLTQLSVPHRAGTEVWVLN